MLDLHSVGMTKEMLAVYLDSLDDLAFSFLCMNDGVPFACFGVQFTDTNKANTFFICTEECFEKHGKWVTLQVIKVLRKNIVNFPELELSLYSGSHNDVAHRWFETIGFAKDLYYPSYKLVRYVYERN